MQHRRGNRYSKNYDLRRVEWERLGASGKHHRAILPDRDCIPCRQKGM